jgi:sec-independent protein translocase protein TatB
MFDIGFWEICLIAVIALLVFGPEKLPGAARTAGLWIGRARRFFNTVRQDIDKELHLQEMQDAIKQSDQTGIHGFIEETKTSLSKLNQPINLDPTKPTEDKTTSGIPSANISQKTETS